MRICINKVDIVGEMSVEELAAKYAGAYASDFELPDTPSSTEVESDGGEDEDQMTSSDEESVEEEKGLFDNLTAPVFQTSLCMVAIAPIGPRMMNIFLETDDSIFTDLMRLTVVCFCLYALPSEATGQCCNIYFCL